MIESITSAYSGMSRAGFAHQVSTSVMKESLNVQEMQGEGVMRLLQSAGAASGAAAVEDPMLGQNVDLLV